MRRDPVRVLVVDDNAVSLRMTEAAMRAEDYEVECFVSGEAVVARLEAGGSGRAAGHDQAPGAEAIDAIICDVMMPGMSGLDVCRRLKAHPIFRDIPILMLTALEEAEHMSAAIEAGADDFLSKPPDIKRLRARLQALLRTRWRFRELGKGNPPDLETLFRARVSEKAEALGLTNRERETLDLLLLGRTAEEIGTATGMATRTAKHHISSVLRKFEVASKMELLRELL